MDLSEKDIQLLKTAHNEELKEMKDGLDAKKKDEKALAAKRARDAVLKAHSHSRSTAKQLPAPFKLRVVHKEGTLSADDKKLLAIARNEISSEHAKDARAEKQAKEAELRREEEKAEAAKKAREAQAKQMHVKQAAHPVARVVAEPKVTAHVQHEKNVLHRKLNPKALKLLASAYRDQRHDEEKARKMKSYDQRAFVKQFKKHAIAIDSDAQNEANMEIQRNARNAMIGLQHATAADNSEYMHAWNRIHF
ncbi:hypothetical protein GUITHDRAFT_108259 [Guillardia theta CCMP2712]|uniref:Uncharacterized protein n=1 Tax=Guillardia theta (strain CCMP2712) TaxID=905079 RepID=L1JCI8_GUITC|nr:hypothetical protein GUITHDRAFT_108259 [Guillardia theta CCMP2712]EKX45809.1 hypothetical protein GUITHDRAFT_108259 [Guillardia theta CCMP2712]|eukprot:XP_005832789.1 hypothetical protein GUITHDRAFT_108259 [Guillardia theta CCMP2712]